MSDIDDPKRIERRRSLDVIQRRRELADVQFVLSSIEGRRLYWRMMVSTGIFKSSFTGNNTTFFNEGERNVGLRMLNDMNEADPEAYLKCLKEAKQADAANR